MNSCNSEGEENYCFVAFVDILGFKELVNSEDREKLETCFSICEELIKFWKKTDGKKIFKVYNFSDSIVIVVPTQNENKKSLFKHLCVALAELQYHLAKNDIWVRGGLSYGKMETSESHDTQQFLRMYGKPLIQAYEIESKISKYPRIVIDPLLIEELSYTTAIEMIEATNSAIDYENWKGDVLFLWPAGKSRITQDVFTFIDFLEYLFHDFGDFENNKNEIFINKIKKNINGNPMHYEKYRWVADYLISKVQNKCPSLEIERGSVEYLNLLRL